MAGDLDELTGRADGRAPGRTAREPRRGRLTPPAVSREPAAWDARRRHPRGIPSNSAYFPLANLLLEWLREGGPPSSAPPTRTRSSRRGSSRPGSSARGSTRGRPRPFLGNLIGPAFYTAVEGAIEGRVSSRRRITSPTGRSPSRSARRRNSACAPPNARLHVAATLAENVLRAAIIVVMYAIFEAMSNPRNASIAGFFADPSHGYVAASLLALGLVIGVAQVIFRPLPRPAARDRLAAQALFRSRHGTARPRARRRRRGEPRAHAPRSHRRLPGHPGIHRLERAPGAGGRGAHAQRLLRGDRGGGRAPLADPHQVHGRRGPARLLGRPRTGRRGGARASRRAGSPPRPLRPLGRLRHPRRPGHRGHAGASRSRPSTCSATR